MLIIGVLLLVLAVAAVLAVLLGSAEQATVQAAGLTWSTTVAGVFLLGAAAVVVLAVGLVLIRAGTARRLRHRREFRRLRREHGAASSRGRQRDSTPTVPPGFGAPGPGVGPASDPGADSPPTSTGSPP